MSHEVRMSLAAFLLALQGPLLNAAVGVALFYLEEYLPWFCALAPKPKRLVTGALSLAIPVLSCVLAMALGYQQIDSLWPAVVVGAAAFGVATMVHTQKLPNA
jgi:hypothetical protein